MSRMQHPTAFPPRRNPDAAQHRDQKQAHLSAVAVSGIEHVLGNIRDHAVLDRPRPRNVVDPIVNPRNDPHRIGLAAGQLAGLPFDPFAENEVRRTLGRIFAINFRKGIVRFDPLRQLLRIEILRTRRHPEREPENGRAVATGRLFETNATLRSSLRSHDIPLRPCRNQFDTGLARQTFLRIGQPATDRIALRHGIRFHDKRIANRHRHRILR